MKKLKLIVAALLLALLASCARAELRITVGGVTYTSRVLGNSVEYWMGGEKLGEARRLGNGITYHDGGGKIVGEATTLGNSIIFRDKSGSEIATRTPLGDKHIYRNAQGREIGTAYVLGWKTEYTDGSGRSIGSADTTDMPLRPIPLERLLSGGGAGGGGAPLPKLNGLCLPFVVQVAPGSPAEAAGLKVLDLVIGCRGADWTSFQFMGVDEAASQNRMIPRFVSTPDDGLVLIVYRPAPKEYDEAKGSIVTVGPLPKGQKGFAWGAQRYCSAFSRAGSVEYTRQAADVYAKWLAAGNDGPALRLPVCLTRVVKVAPGGQAEQAGMNVGDFLVGFAGQKGTVLDLAGPAYWLTLQRVKARLSANQEQKDIVYVVYRPAAGERNTACGQIVALAPMQPGKKGYSYNIAEETPYYTRDGSHKYAAQIRALYEKWLADGSPAALAR